MKYLSLLGLALCLIACEAEQIEEPEITEEENLNYMPCQGHCQPEPPRCFMGTTLDFEDFKLLIDTAKFWSNSQVDNSPYADTAKITASMGADVQSRMMEIVPNGASDFQVSMQFENSLLVRGENATCELDHWKHYQSNWIPISLNKAQFKMGYFKRAEKFKFVDVSMAEVRAEVSQHCGDEWLPVMKSAKSVYAEPFDIWVNHILLKIDYLPAFSSTRSQKYIDFTIPFGC